MALVPLLSLVMSVATPMLQPHAYAATGSKNDIADRVFSYQAYMMMSSQCIWTPGDGAIRAAEVKGWMATGSAIAALLGPIANGDSFNTNKPVGSAFQKYVGISDSNLAKVDCDDPLWINKALSLWGYQPADFLQAIQNEGGFRTDKTNYTTFKTRDHTREWAAVTKVIQKSAFYKGASLASLSPDERYYDWLTNFTTQCSAKFTTSSNPNTSEDKIGPKTQAYINGTLTDGYWHYVGNSSVDVGTALTKNGLSSCADMARAVADAGLVNAFIVYIKAGGAAPESGATGSGPAGNDDLSVNCGSKVAVLLNPLNWLMCPIIESLTGIARGLDNGINDMLTIDVGTTFAKTHNKGNYGAWEQMRIYAIIFLVIATLIIVISQALGFELLDAYTVRKVLPRLLIAAVAISISWELMTFFVRLTNDLGAGIRAIIYAPFSKLTTVNTINLGGGGLAIANLIGVGAIAALGVMGLLSFVATAALAVAVAFFVLVLRQLLITMLIILAPIAIVCYILPNTQKVWKLWWDAFAKGLMMFPIIAAFIAVGRVGAATASQTAAQGGGALYSFIAFVSYFAPYLLLPLTFRFAGGLIGTIGGFANNKGRGAFDGLKNFRGNQMKQRRQNAAHRAQTGNTFKRAGDSNSIRSKLNRGIQGTSLVGQAGFDPRNMRTNLRTAMRDSSESSVGKFMQDSQSFAMWSGDDAKLAAARFDSHDQIGAELDRFDGGRFAGNANAARREEAISQIMRTKKEVDNPTLQKARVRAQAKTGTGYQYTDASGQNQFDSSRMLDDINSAYGNDRNGAGRALAEMRGSLAQSGQIAGVAGFGTWATQLEGRYNNTTSAQAAHNMIMDDAINSASPGQAIYGKPSSAAAMGAAHARRITAIADGITAGTYTEDDLSAAMAGAAGIYDAMAQASPGNASAMANELMGVEIDGPSFTINSRREQVHADSGKPVLGPDGRPLMETISQTVQPRTIREYIQSQMQGNAEFANRRRDFSQSTLAEAQAAQRNLPLPGTGGPPAAPTGGPPAPPL